MKRLGLSAMAGVLVAALAGTASAQGWRGGGGGWHGGGAWHGSGGGWHGGGAVVVPHGGYGYRAAPIHTWGPNRWGGSHVYVRPLAPSHLHVWVPGYWGYNAGVRVWIDGGWYLPPHPGWSWVAPQWVWNGYQWVWQQGYWAPPAY